MIDTRSAYTEDGLAVLSSIASAAKSSSASMAPIVFVTEGLSADVGRVGRRDAVSRAIRVAGVALVIQADHHGIHLPLPTVSVNWVISAVGGPLLVSPDGTSAHTDDDDRVAIAVSLGHGRGGADLRLR